jgi:hypothetical protein
MFQTTYGSATVTPRSAALEVNKLQVAPHFGSAADARAWRAQGSPPRPGAGEPHHTVRHRISLGRFSFLPQGTPLTYSEVRELSSTAASVAAEIRRHVAALITPVPSAAMLRAYGFLLGTAPLTASSRRALARAVSLLPGVFRCGARRDPLHRAGSCLAVIDHGIEYQLILRTRDERALSVVERLVSRSSFYPHVPVGHIVGADTFVGT